MTRRVIATGAAIGVLTAIGAGAAVNSATNDGSSPACTKPITFIAVDEREALDALGYYIRGAVAGNADFPKGGFEFDYNVIDASTVEPGRIVAEVMVYDTTRQFIYDLTLTRSCVEDGWHVVRFERPGKPAAAAVSGPAGGAAANPDK